LLQLAVVGDVDILLPAPIQTITLEDLVVEVPLIMVMIHQHHHHKEILGALVRVMVAEVVVVPVDLEEADLQIILRLV
jgi:hypothetical protein